MLNQKITLEKIQSVSTILSALAIPVILAVLGYSVQKGMAESSIKKDYLTMAIGMLRDGGENLDPEMKAWATAVVSEFSPVPFTAAAKDVLGQTLYVTPSIPALPAVARQKDLGALCDSGCSRALEQKLNKWRQSLSEVGEGDVIMVMQDILDQSIQHNADLAGALDISRVSGLACVDIYEGVRGVLDRSNSDPDDSKAQK